MVVIRVGLGRTPSGKILDRWTQWYNLDEVNDAIDFAKKTKRQMFISYHGCRYRPITEEQLLNIVTK